MDAYLIKRQRAEEEAPAAAAPLTPAAAIIDATAHVDDDDAAGIELESDFNDVSSSSSSSSAAAPPPAKRAREASSKPKAAPKPAPRMQLATMAARLNGSPEWVPVPEAAPRKKSAPKPKPKPTILPDGSKAPTLEAERRRLGDAVKGHISFTKWCIDARTHAVVDIDANTFRANIVPHASSVTPAAWDATSPVVVARIEGSTALGEAFGKTKITGGSRMGTWTADVCDVIFRPQTSKADLWWTMQGGW
jgi:hypothetical protein